MRLLNVMARWLIAMLMAGLAATLLTLPAAAQTTTGTAKPAAASATATAATTTTDRAYVLGADDTISVTVYGQSDAGVQTRIKPDGTIVMPLIGNVQAAGQTVVSLADLITKKLVAGNYFKSPVVNVEVGAFASKTVNVAGKVGQPGVYPLDRTYHALEVLLKAGWVKDQGANYVFLRRADNKEIRLETEALVRGAADQDPILLPGDTLYVPDADTFFITGQIAKPGTMPVLPGLTVRQALAMAGGVTATGNGKKIGLFRAGSTDKKATIPLDALVQKGDILVIKERLF
ncbi:polysaccharide export protein [Sphingosinicellaceae bacterium]|nr:polysaccharide export protein [Sphingosinicellaceae bacterium]